MKKFFKHIFRRKAALLITLLITVIILSNLKLFWFSFASLYYFVAGFISGTGTEPDYFYIERWLGAVYLLVCLFVSIGLLSGKLKQRRQTNNFFIEKILKEISNNTRFRYALLFLYLVISSGIIAPFISSKDPFEINSLAVTKYLPPLSSAKYIEYNALRFDAGSFSYIQTDDPLTRIKQVLKTGAKKIYYDSISITSNSLVLHQGSLKKELPPYSIDLEKAVTGSDTFLLGTDAYGRDVLTRIVYGARVSLGIAAIASITALLLGVILGLLSGYLSGIVDGIIMRSTDIFLSFPVIFLLLLIVGVFGSSFMFIAIFIGFTFWMDVARLTRAQVMTVKKEPYVVSARASGLSSFRILSRHILPNVITPIIINVAFKIGIVILMESALSFIGIGVNEPIPSWGSIINSGKDSLISAWWISFFPGAAITLMVILFNYLGDVLRDIIKIK